MSPYQDPKDAVVSVWRHADDPDAFLGSGVFVSPQLILTAKHVIGSRRPEEIHIGLIDGLEQRAPAQTFHVHEQYDVALIELVRAFPKQGLVKPDANRASLDDARVALAGVNLDTKNRDLCDGYTLGNWNAATGAYLFDHAPRKGFSGGIVVLDSCAVGVIIQRHREDQQGVMIPLYAVAEWLQSVLGPTLLEFEPADLPIPDPSLPAAFTQDLQTIRQRIHDRLQPAPVKGLREALVQELDTDAVARALVPSHPDQLVDALDHLHQATESCLQPPAAPDADRLEAITAAAREIFGWLIVLAVDHQQAQAAGHDFDPWQGGMQVDIPLNSEAGIEALVSALGDRAAAFKLTYDHHHSPRVSGAHSLIPDELELGIGPSDQLREILKRIWMRVMQTEELPADFAPRDQERLEAILKTRRRRRIQDHYIPILPDREHSPLSNQALLEQLARALPSLRILYLTGGQGPRLLLLQENDLWALIHEFLLLCETPHDA